MHLWMYFISPPSKSVRCWLALWARRMRMLCWLSWRPSFRYTHLCQSRCLLILGWFVLGVFFSSFYCLKRSDFFCFKGWRFSTSWSAHWALACSARAKEGCERLKAQMQHYFKLPVCGSLSLSLTFCSCLVSREKTSGSEAGWRGSVGVVADGLAIRIAHTLISLNTKTQAHREHTVLSCQLFQWFFLNLTQHMHCMYWLYLLWWG